MAILRDKNNPQDILKKDHAFMKKMKELGIDIDGLDIFQLEKLLEKYKKGDL